MLRISVFVLFLISYNIAKSQDLQYYIQANRYPSSLLNHKNVENYDFIGHAYIDKDNFGIIDYTLLQQRIINMYPSKQAKAVLVLNLENKIYNNLKSDNIELREKAVKEFVNMVRFVKELRPNLKVGIYGIPFRFNYDFQKRKNYKRELLPLIKETDFLAPDLYFSFAKVQQNDKQYVKIVQENIDLFIDFAKIYNKPIKIFVWSKIHPYNRRFKRQDVAVDRMYKLIQIIGENKKEYFNIQGVLWWDSWEAVNQKSREKLSNNFLKYMSSFLK